MLQEPRVTSFPGKLPPPFKLLMFVDYPTGFFSRLHVHDVYQQVLVLRGCFTFEFPECAPMLLTSGQFGVVPAGYTHSWKAVSRTTCKTLIITHEPFDSRFHRELSRAFGGKTGLPRQADLQLLRTEFLVDSLWDECIERRPAGASLVYGILIHLLTLASRCCPETDTVGNVPEDGDESQYAT